ncbi:MAG: hypothetical protein FIB08_12225 [Candidatus Methanoperedens sp.]|nr:hypothetical protein [Candidatus Methanoperedens sp.]
MFDEKAQLHTLEGVAASILLIGVIIYAIDATSMTPLTSSTSNAHVESELAALGQDILNTLDYAEPGYNSKLKSDILNWDGKEYLWNGTKYIENTDATYSQNILTNNLTEVLKSSLISRGIAHKVELRYIKRKNNVTEPSEPFQWIYAGVPSHNAVIVSKKIVLQMGDTNGLDLGNYAIEPIDLNTELFNIVEIKLVLWRT